ncbi:putative IQ motif, EF-hand binding protein [Medicago truncatula]|uniref:Putative IQ motif, EF-hand binding protein n=1 Tax=Medicago truncatula TaxID=3880 RepID=A0A396HEQ7_MEDTR|nr:putative IQ motif, EF-hand binding protein [Medicago truncatula]
MAKMGWFSMVKKLFTRDIHSTQEKVGVIRRKEKKCVFGRLKNKRFPSIEAPPPLKETRLCEPEALTVAIASAAAAEAAFTAAQVAVEVVRFQSAYQCKGKPEVKLVKTKHNASQSTHSCKLKIEESSAIKIQTTFRGYIARKALKALKGIVKLQAIIRGRAVRRQAMSTLKCLQSIVSIQSQVISRKLQIVERKLNCGEHEKMQGSRDKIIRMDENSERKWDDSILMKTEVDSSSISKKEAIIRKERVKEYSYNHRKSAESERKIGRWKYWMEQWVDTQHSKSKELEDLDSVFGSRCREVEDCGRRQLKFRQIQRQNEVERFDSPLLSSRKYLHHRSKNLEGEDHSFQRSHTIPTYMVATKSTQAKVRSTSTPKTRIGRNWDMSSDCYSPSKRMINNNQQQGSPSHICTRSCIQYYKKEVHPIVVRK